MSTYRITDPKTGKTMRITGESPPSESQLNEIFAKASGDSSPRPSIPKRAWDALKVPEQKSREGLKMMASLMPANVTGNLSRDVAANAPRLMTETLSEVAPGFISRGAMLTSGALKGIGATGKVLKPILKGAGRQLESASGSMPGTLEKAYKDPTLIISKGKEIASPIYEEGKAVGGAVRTKLIEISEPKKLVDEAMKLVKKGKLNPTEALSARKALDQVKKKVTKDFFLYAREKLDGVAKQVFEKADIAHKRGMMAESLRNILPQNKYGGASAFKMGIIPALSGLGGYVAGPPGATAGAALGAGLLSPIVQGAFATTGGIVARRLAPIVSQAGKVGSTAGGVVSGMKKKEFTPVEEKIETPVLKTVQKELTKEKAKEFLKKAKGNKDKAREMAIKEGYEIPGYVE